MFASIKQCYLRFSSRRSACSLSRAGPRKPLLFLSIHSPKRLQLRLRSVDSEKLVDVHFAIFHMTLHFHFLAHMSFDLLGVADFCDVALLVDKNDVAALFLATPVTLCNRFVVLDTRGIAYPNHLLTRVTLVLTVYNNHYAQVQW